MIKMADYIAHPMIFTDPSFRYHHIPIVVMKLKEHGYIRLSTRPEHVEEPGFYLKIEIIFPPGSDALQIWDMSDALKIVHSRFSWLGFENGTKVSYDRGLGLDEEIELEELVIMAEGDKCFVNDARGPLEKLVLKFHYSDRTMPTERITLQSESGVEW
jgi:hypothetical protein